MSVSRNTAYNLMGTAAPVLVALVSIPIYIRLIGEQRYGMLSIAWILLGYFGVFDLGIGRAAAQRIARQDKSNRTAKANAFWTALALNTALGVAGGLVLWPAAYYFFSQQFQIDESLRPEVLAALPWLMLALPLATVTGVLSGALQGVERFRQLNAINATGSILFQTLPLFAAWLWTPDLGVLMPVAIFARLLGVTALYFVCLCHVSGGASPAFKTHEVRELLKFGGWVTVSSFISPIMVMADRFIIGALLGAKAVTLYTVPFQLAERSTIVASALSSSLFPRFAKGTLEESRAMGTVSIQLLIVLMTPVMVAAILLARPFLSVWISPDFSQHTTLVLQILLIGFWINGFSRVPHAQLQAMGRPDVVAICHAAEVVPFLFVLYLSLQIAGVAGAAAAFSLRVYVDFLLLAGQAGILKKTLLLKFSGLLFLLASVYLSRQTYSGIASGLADAFLFGTSCVWALAFAPPVLKTRLKLIAKRFRFSN